MGAVALDASGSLACGIHFIFTESISNFALYKVGDSPLVGCGGYANEYGAASATGHGEVQISDRTLQGTRIFEVS